RGFTPGGSVEVLEVAGVRLGVLNCYEDVREAHARRVAVSAPDLLVNLTNDAWFGATTEPALHQRVARLRAVETRRDVVRAVNTGISSHIAATGEELLITPVFAETAFVARARRLTGRTPWVRFGDLVTPSLLAWLLISAWAGVRSTAVRTPLRTTSTTSSP